jgi:hypothetical protein
MSEVIRGLSTDAPVQTTEANIFNVAERTDLAVATLGSLGLVSEKSSAAEHIGQLMQSLHDQLSASGTDKVEPYVSLELSEQFGLGALVTAFDAKAKYATYVYDTLWSKYGPAALNSRRVGDKSVAGTSSHVSGSARAMLLDGSNDYNEPGLHHVGMTYAEQRRAVKGDELLTPADYIILQAQRREAGMNQLDKRTFTRFVQLDKKSADGRSWVPCADWDFDRLVLRGSNGRARSSGGGRLSVGPEA